MLSALTSFRLPLHILFIWDRVWRFRLQVLTYCHRFFIYIKYYIYIYVSANLNIDFDITKRWNRIYYYISIVKIR